jgi:fucose 4-O-acetylase-like acetyltransferase
MLKKLYLKKNNNKRIEWLDEAKGIGIVLVMLQHYWNSQDLHLFFVWIVSFHMPLFFICSGYSFSNKRNIKDYIIHKLRTIIVPYFCLGIIVQVFVVVKEYFKCAYSSGDFLERCWNLLLQRHWEILWFLPALFLTEILYKIVYTVLEGNKKKIILVFVALLFVAFWYYEKIDCFLPWCVDVVFVSETFFFVGHLMAEKKLLEKNLICKIILSLSINIISMYVNYIVAGEALSMMQNKYGILPLGIISGISGSVFLMCTAEKFNSSLLKYIGKNSLLYYAWHVQIVWTIEEVLFKLLHVFQTELSVIERCGKVAIQILFAIFILTLCNEIIRSTRLKIVLGMKEGDAT